MIVPATSNIHLAVQTLQQGNLVVLPTETVYGLGADGTQDDAVAKIYAAKERPTFNPLIFHVKDLNAAETIGIFSKTARSLAQAFWPGPLTLVVKKNPDADISLLATAGLDTIAIRVPAHPIMQAVLKLFDKPIVAPSANPSGFLSATTAAHVEKHLGTKVPLILDGGSSEKGLESTIIEASGDRPAVLRYGALPLDKIESLLSVALVERDQRASINAPGQLESHYAPTLPLRLNALEPLQDEVFLGFGIVSYSQWNLSAKGDLAEAAANFFSYLHALDTPAYKRIAVAPIPKQGLGIAINDRLNRAAAPKDIT